jgi:hypothetical protein
VTTGEDQVLPNEKENTKVFLLLLSTNILPKTFFLFSLFLVLSSYHNQKTKKVT